ncbi:hypothetical protein [Novipirellula caenicola]|uniref:Secreted protein n=1 Tax=Novipirellula caenicola TaxID=1536901 RepID=A0ABP9VZ00_9BACT
MLSLSLRRTGIATGLLIVTLGVSFARSPFDFPPSAQSPAVPAETTPAEITPLETGPTETAPTETLPTEASPEPSSTPNPIEQKIRSVLEGASDDVRSSDPLLDDVLGIIKSRGSILDGSSLDPALDAATGPAGNDREASVRAAESLLRSARLLSQIEPQDSARTELVAKLRYEAWRLLSESVAVTKQ